MIDVDLIIHDSAQLLTMQPGLSTAPEEDVEARELGAIPGGAVAIKEGSIEDVGTSEKIVDTFRAERKINASGMVVTPGFVDPHTHSIFAGSRHMEFGMRMNGATYLEILEAGGGIHSTVRSTRAASSETLLAEAMLRLDRALRFGVTTMEIKSGYGLDTETEIKMLDVARRLDQNHPISVVPTYLGAHVVPAEYKTSREKYVSLMIDETIPRIAASGLARACDVFLDDGAFTKDEARAVLEAARKAGMSPKIHAGQFTDQAGPELIADLGGLSADHLEVVSDAGVAAMAEGGVVASLLPGAAFSLRDNFPDGRRYADAGVRVALATDNNPGSSRSENLPLMASMGVTRMGLSCAEAMKGITVNAAAALGLEGEIGMVRAGQKADLVLLSIPDFRAFLYHFGINHTAMVVANGKVEVEESSR